MMEVIMQNVLLPLLIALATGLTALIGYGFKFLFKYIQVKIDTIKSVEERDFLFFLKSQAEECINDAVVLTNVTLVDELKKASEDGIITSEEAERAYTVTKNTFKTNFGYNNYDTLSSLLPNIDVWIKNKIEGFVKIHKG